MTIEQRKEILTLGALLALCFILLGFRLGKTGLIDPDEPFYSLTAKEMLTHHDLSTPLMFGKPQFEKPVLFYWVICSFFSLFGVNEFSARLGPCLAGFAVVFLTYFWAMALFRRRQTAFVSAALLAASAEFVILSRIVLTDIFLCLFVTATLACFTFGERYPQRRALFWNLMFVFSALGFLTKGPLGFFIPFAGIVSYSALAGGRCMLGEIPWGSGLALFALIGLPWYGLMAWKYGPSFLEQTFLHENIRRFFVAEHPGSDRPSFYFFTLFLGFFPWSGFLIPAFVDAARKAVRSLSGGPQKKILFLFLSFILPFIFFSFARSKLMSYIFPLFPVAAILTGSWMSRLFRAVRLGIRPKPSLAVMNALVWGALPAALAAEAFRFAGKNGVEARAPLTFIALSMVPLLWASLYFFSQKKYRAGFITTILAMIFLSSFSYSWLLPQIETAISSKQWAETYEKSPKSRSGLLTSKLFLRGVSFYADSPLIGVFSGKQDAGFYTPHPVPVVSDAEGLSRMAAGGNSVYLLLREKEWKFLNSINEGRYSLSVLETTPQRRWVRLEHV